MADDDDKSRVKIGLGMEARLEVKTEVPPESSGRLLDAVTDVIRPWTEKRGLKGDLLRLQREEVLIEIAKRATQRAEIEGIDIQPVPNKILVPMLEKASLEELDSPLLPWWENLLLSAADENIESRPYFVDLINKIGSEEARLLEDLWQGWLNSTGDPDFGHTLGLSARVEIDFERAVNNALERARGWGSKDWMPKYEFFLEDEFERFKNKWTGSGIIFREIRIRKQGRVHTQEVRLGGSVDLSILVCRGLEILEHRYFHHSPDVFDVSGDLYSVTITTFTNLGTAFMTATHRDSR